MCVNFNNQRLDSDNERFANFDKMMLENNRTIYQKSNKIISSIHCSDSGNGRSDKDESRFIHRQNLNLTQYQTQVTKILNRKMVMRNSVKNSDTIIV
jgi:hypothetical protein